VSHAADQVFGFCPDVTAGAVVPSSARLIAVRPAVLRICPAFRRDRVLPEPVTTFGIVRPREYPNRRFEMYKYAMAGICLLFATSIHAQNLAQKGGTNPAVGSSPSTQEFVTEAANGDMLEIQSSKLAEQKAANPQTKQFASQMVTDHQKSTDELKALVNGGKVKANLPTAMDSAHQSKLDKLKNLSGAQFDKAFDDMQRSAHKDAVSMFERYAKSGDNPDLKAFASKILPVIQHHLQMADNLGAGGTTQGRGR
jgi:putative membrane protein